MNDADKAADTLNARALNIVGAFRPGEHWFVRVESASGAPHDTYQVFVGDTLTEALQMAVAWSERLSSFGR